MTAGTAEKVWRLRDKRVTPAAGAVLTYLAYRAYYKDGRCAWPAIKKIAQCCFISERTVVRALEQLIDLGYVQVSPNQHWNTRDAETGEWKRKGYRSTVYDVLVENFIDVIPVDEERKEDERQAQQERDNESSMEPEKQTCQNVSAAKTLESSDSDSTDKMSGLPEDAVGSTDKLSKNSGQNVILLTNDLLIPPTPTGYPPASGETLPEKVDEEKPDADEDVQHVLDVLASARRRAGLTIDEPSKRDRRSVRRLLDRLAGGGEKNAGERVEFAIEWAMRDGGAYWKRLLRSGRVLAARWNELLDDMTIAAGNTLQARTHSEPVQTKAHTHSSCCTHVKALLGMGDDAMPTVMGQIVAQGLNDGLSESEALEKAREYVHETELKAEQEARAKREAQAQFRRDAQAGRTGFKWGGTRVISNS